jgi:BirA family transcriptional regulator, biotin operon repressor / biotin---[acetyl-CoA-carboxylase] ligase
MREKIIELLKKNREYVSGDQISHRLGITRQALWKHIQELKDSGYEIVAVPHLGYRLDALPDRLFEHEIKSGLNTHTIGRWVHYFEALSSTMGAATQLALDAAPEGTIVVAETQTKGKGRLGRSWFSPRHKGIYCSLILRPGGVPSEASLLTLLTAVSIIEALKEQAGAGAKIKWPNDIYLGTKKLGGILTELNAEMDRINFVIVGFGLNVNNEKKSLISGATSLKSFLDRTEPINRVGLLQEIMRRMEHNYSLFQKGHGGRVLEKGRHYSCTIGTRVRVYCQTKHIEGEAVDIDSDGALLVRRDTGIIDKVTAGDVLHCR